MFKRLTTAILLISLPLSGCLAGRSPDQYGYALVIGVDAGQTRPYYISMLIQRGSDDCPFMGVECADIFEAAGLLEGALPYSLNFSRATALVFSKEAAQNGLMAQFLSMSLGSTGIRHYANLLISDCRAEDYLSGIQGELNKNVAKYQYSLVEYGQNTGYIPSITLAEFYARAWNSAGDVIIPLGTYAGGDEGAARKGGLESAAIGCAVFNGAQMAGVLDGEHTQVLLMAAGMLKQCRMRIDIGGKSVSVLIKQESKPKVRLTLDEKPIAKISVSLSAATDEPETQKNKEIAESEISAYIEERLLAVYTACRDKGADAFSLGKAAVKLFRDTQSWEEYPWKEVYAKTDAEFEVAVRLENNSSVSKME